MFSFLSFQTDHVTDIETSSKLAHSTHTQLRDNEERRGHSSIPGSERRHVTFDPCNNNKKVDEVGGENGCKLFRYYPILNL